MKKIGIFYGSSTGHTETDALLIAENLGVDKKNVFNVNNTKPDAVADYDMLILGSSTWGSGDLQDDWYDFIAGLKAMYLKGKRIALFGTGDETMADTFCDAVGELYNDLQATKADFVGESYADCYDFKASKAVGKDGVAVGLLLDDVNHPEMTPARIKAWTESLKKQL